MFMKMKWLHQTSQTAGEMFSEKPVHDIADRLCLFFFSNDSAGRTAGVCWPPTWIDQ
jgi:hypothetical protein